MTSRRHLLGAALIGALPLTGCGFRLRGSYSTPFRTLYLQMPENSYLAVRLRQELLAGSDVTIVNTPSEAEAILELLSDSRSRDVLSINDTGRAREYEITLSLSFRVSNPSGIDYMEAVTLTASRDLTYSESDFLSREKEEAFLYRDMEADLVNQLMGYTDRQVLDMNASADWSRLTMAAADIGMFDDRKIVDVRLSTGNPGKNGAPAIVKYLDNPIDGVVTLITMPAPDWTVTKEAWWGALQRKATVVDCSPVERAQLPAWLKARLARHELVMSPETLDYFADMMEGNLFAAAQEIEKLSLLHPKGEITSEQLRQAVSSNARFDFDTLFESMRLGQADRIVRIIDGLEAQAEALPFLLAMLTAEIRSLIKLRTGYDNGQSRVTGVFATPSLQKAARRLTVKKLCGALSVCADIDRLVKGLSVPKRDSDPWIELKSVVLFLAS